MYLLSANGTLRTILILLILWQLLRLWMRMQQKDQGGRRAGHTTGQQRPKGDVRIEQLKEIRHGAPPADAEDADFEEIK
jgi:hypothetical protein